jgi:hypothetical protein
LSAHGSPFCYFHTKMAYGIARPYEPPSASAEALIDQIDWDPVAAEPWEEEISGRAAEVPGVIVQKLPPRE